MVDQVQQTETTQTDPQKVEVDAGKLYPTVAEKVADPAKEAADKAAADKEAADKTAADKTAADAKAAEEAARANETAEQKAAREAAAKEAEDRAKADKAAKETAEKAAKEWKPYVDDPAKSAEENAAAKAEHEKTKPADFKAEPISIKDIVLPEGMIADEKTQTAFVELANKHGLSRETVHELVKLQADALKGLSERGKTEWEKTQADWKEAATKDPVVGGDKLQPALSNIAKLINTYGDDEFRAVMDLTGAGNHPAFIRTLAKVASKLVVEGGPVLAGNPTVPADGDVASKLYPSHSK